MIYMSKSMFFRSSRFDSPRYINGIGILFFFGILWYFLITSGSYAQKPNKALHVTKTLDVHATGTSRILKLSMLYGKPNALYERALNTHQAHSTRWNHSFHVLREDLATGFWNKPTYMLNMLTEELMKPARERAEWLMWVDADSIVINPSISPAIFLPPDDLSHLHIVATHDFNGLNTGIFFLRVNAWSVNFLIETLGMPLYKPDVNLGRSADQEAMAKVLNKTTGGPDNRGYRRSVVYVPRSWINMYELDSGYEGKPGNMLVHFPGLEQARWKHMSDWLDLLDARPEEWDRSLNHTDYWNSTRSFWREYRSSLKLISDIGELEKVDRPGNSSLHRACEQLQRGLELNADNIPSMARLRYMVYYEMKLARAV